MISDALDKAVNEIDRCLAAHPEIYSGIEVRIKKVREDMDNLRNEIDCSQVSGLEDMARTAGHS
jgi:hypothetical protein